MADVINKIDSRVQVIFEKGEGVLLYRDAIWLTEDEFNLTSSDTIEQIKQERYDAWLAVINSMNNTVLTQPTPVEDTTTPVEDTTTPVEDTTTTTIE